MLSILLEVASKLSWFESSVAQPVICTPILDSGAAP
jgi:hypothetical protein